MIETINSWLKAIWFNLAFSVLGPVVGIVLCVYLDVPNGTYLVIVIWVLCALSATTLGTLILDKLDEGG